MWLILIANNFCIFVDRLAKRMQVLNKGDNEGDDIPKKKRLRISDIEDENERDEKNAVDSGNKIFLI